MNSLSYLGHRNYILCSHQLIITLKTTFILYFSYYYQLSLHENARYIDHDKETLKTRKGKKSKMITSL